MSVSAAPDTWSAPLTTTKNGTDLAPTSTNTSPRATGRRLPRLAIRATCASFKVGNSRSLGVGAVGCRDGDLSSPFTESQNNPSPVSGVCAPAPDTTLEPFDFEAGFLSGRCAIGRPRNVDRAEGMIGVCDGSTC